MVYKPASSHNVFLRNIDDPAWNLCSYCLINRTSTFDMLADAMNAVTKENDALRMKVENNGDITFFDHFERSFKRMTFESKEDFLSWARERADEPVSDCPGFWTAYLIDINGRKGIYNIGNHIMCDAINVTNLYQKIIEKLDGKDGDGYSYAEYLEGLEKYRSSAAYAKDAKYWEGVLQEELPGALPETVDSSCDNIVVRMPEIKQFCDKNGLSEAAVVYALTAILLMRLKGMEALTLGIPTLGRVTQKEMSALGLFMRSVPMIIHGGKCFADIIHDTENNLFDLFRHQKYDLPLKHLFDVTVDYSVYPDSSDFEAGVIYNGYVSTAMEFHYLRTNQLELTIRCRHGLFRNLRAVADVMVRLTEGVLSNLSQDPRDILIAETAPEICNAPFPETGLYQLAQTAANTGRIIDGDNEYSVSELLRDAEKIDVAVRGAKRVIAVICDRSYSELAAIYGIVRGGNAYLPIAPDCPKKRIDMMLRICKCDTILADRKHKNLVRGSLVIEEILSAPAPATVPAPAAAPNDTLYVIFTSGSTGIPKGVEITNRSAVNRILWMCKRYFNHDTVVMRKTPYTFDVSVWEIFGFALGGFSLYILPPEEHYRQDRVMEHIVNGGVTDLHFVPTVFNEFLKALSSKAVSLPSLKNVFLSGEALTANMVNASPAPVHNLYGPTECAVDVSYYDCAETESDPVPIGKPIDNCGIYVLDCNLQPVPLGIEGQICISGVPVGKGYMNDRRRTEEAFVPNPFGEGKLYLTGDIGYWREDGQLIYVGRRDQQVKINGQRIEIGEIEAALSALVLSAAVAVEEGRLIAFYTGEERTDLRTELSRMLPHFMIPHSFIHVDKMPLTASGKIDRQALQKIPRKTTINTDAPSTQEEKTLVSAIMEALSLNSVSRSDNFYEIGGDSLSSIHVIALLRDRGYEISITDFLKSDTLADAAKMMKKTSASEQRDFEGVAPPPPIVKAYLYEKPDDISQFAQAVTIPVDATEREIRAALDIVVAKHDSLRSVFYDDGSFSTGNATYAFRTAQEHSSDDAVTFNLHTGPLVDAVLYPGHLKLTIHHFAVDAVSWTVIINDFKLALQHKPLLPQTASYQEWARLQQATVPFSVPSEMLPVIGADEPYSREERCHISVKAYSNQELLTALALAANGIVGGRAGICVETHGRADSRFSRTVGWLTAIYPFTTESLEETRRTLNSVPELGVGYLRTHGHLPRNASLLYNYIPMGGIESVGSIALFPGKINVNCFQRNNGVDIEVGVPAGRHAPGIAAQIGKAFEKCLAESDERFAAEPDEIESVYDLTPTQYGMLRHWSSYWMQYTIAFGNVDFKQLEQALILLARRHPILKSQFIEQGNGEIKGVILRTRYPFLRCGNEECGDPASLFRVTVEDDRLIIHTHHSILDGWSLSILARDLKLFYENPNMKATSSTPVNAFSDWTRDLPSAIPYWKELLSDCGVSSDFPHKGSATGKQPHRVAESHISRDGVIEFARVHHVSVNTVLEAAFSLVLLRNNPTAIFGKMVSGRNAPIPGIHDMVAPFANMIPMYAKGGEPLLPQIHEQSIRANQYGFAPLAELYDKTDLKRINVLFIYENYPAVKGVTLLNYHEENEFDLTITVRDDDGGFCLRASYAPEKYEDAVIKTFFDDYAKTLHRFVSEEAKPICGNQQHAAFSPPVNETEENICHLFERIIGVERVGRDDSFYDLGGTSLNMMEMLSKAPLDTLAPTVFMQNPTPAALADCLSQSAVNAVITPLYKPETATAAYVLFPYGGGDAAAYTALVAEFRKRKADVALYFVPWGCDYDAVADKLRALPLPLRFYSHCAGAVIAMKLLDRGSIVEKYIAGASIPPEDTKNIWSSVSDETLFAVLQKAGMPSLPKSQVAAMLSQFRENTMEYFDYLQNKNKQIPVSVSVVLGRHDIFTESISQVTALWERFVDHVADVHSIDCSTHYFQSACSAELADYLLEA